MNEELGVEVGQAGPHQLLGELTDSFYPIVDSQQQEGQFGAVLYRCQSPEGGLSDPTIEMKRGHAKGKDSGCSKPLQTVEMIRFQSNPGGRIGPPIRGT